MTDNRFSRTEALLGKAALERLAQCHVAIFGLGGVGSFAAEAIARGGVGRLTLIDGDVVDRTNLNRQLVALESTIGKSKAEVMAQRVRQINPMAEVEPMQLFFLPDTAEQVDFSAFDYVIDAVDMVTAKLLIIEKCHAVSVPVISCMGTGNKLNPMAFEVTEIEKTSVCPLAKVMRKELKQRGISGVKAVYSKEVPIQTGLFSVEGRPLPASISFVPPAAGLLLASEVIRTLAGIN